MSKVVNLRTARKQKDRTQKRASVKSGESVSGLSKDERELLEQNKARFNARLDGHKQDD